MFKKGAFELEASVFPVAIRYNKIFVDAFWNSKKQSFTAHLVRFTTRQSISSTDWYLVISYRSICKLQVVAVDIFWTMHAWQSKKSIQQH
jgi:hypothetical protein